MLLLALFTLSFSNLAKDILLFLPITFARRYLNLSFLYSFCKLNLIFDLPTCAVCTIIFFQLFSR